LRLKLDENLGNRGADPFREAGHDVATVLGQDLCSTPDPALIDICRAEGRCLITMDLDFGNPLLFKPSEYAGIALLRLVEQDEAGHFVAECPAFKACYTQGKTYEEAIENIKDVIALCLAERR